MMICRIAHAHYPPPDYLSRLTKKYSIALPFCGKQDPPIISSAYEDGSIVSKTGFRWRGLFLHHCSTSGRTSNALRSVGRSFRKEIAATNCGFYLGTFWTAAAK